MSGIKRTLSGEDSSQKTDSSNEQPASPTDSPGSKKLRRTSSTSENELTTQIIDQENGIINGLSTSPSETEEQEVDNDIEGNSSDHSIVPVDFDNGKNDIFRYDGTIIFHTHIPSRGRDCQVSSEPSIIRTFSWTLITYLHLTYDNSLRTHTKSISLFLKCEPEKKSTSWSIFAKAELILLHRTDSNKNFVQKISHLFNVRSNDWGFHQLKSLKEINSDFLHSPDNTVRIIANIHADPPRNVEWDSKGQTGFVGLRNIGATCYMNSFLQTIYFTKKLRKAVYALPTDSDDQAHSIPLALQKLFYDLQFTDRSVSTKKLTRSFGWDKPDEFCQHDIQEFCRVLLDKLESKMEGTTMEGIIPSLFQGQYVQYVRCTQVQHESRVQQTFYDVPLQIRNNANIIESFRDFCKSEILTGENLYDAGDVHGLQEAEKGVQFQHFPPVLCLHLLRFEYDYNLCQNRKINDSYSFDYHLNLSEFLENSNSSSCSYKLLSILVHSGDNSSGHYVSFINPELDEQWFKFDDEVVAHVASSDAIERNFGGIKDDDGSMYNTSAYMLVYIREDYQKDVLCDIDLKDIPKNLIKRFDYEKKSFFKRRENMLDNDDLIYMQIILNTDFYIRQTFNLNEIIYETSIDFPNDKYYTRFIRARSSELFSGFVERLAHEMGVNLDEDIRIWIVNTHKINIGHQNHIHYHSQALTTTALTYCDDYDKTIIDLFQYKTTNRQIISIFVEQKIFLNGVYQLLPFDKNDDILVFVCLYDSQNESPLFIGHFLFSKQQSLKKCLNDIAVRIERPVSSSTKFIVYQSVPKHNQTHQYESIKSSNFDLPLSQALHPCISGTSIMIQILDMNQAHHEKFTTALVDYFQNFSNRQEFYFLNLDNLRNDYLFKLYLPMETSIKEIIRLIAERINYPEQQIIVQKSINSITQLNTTPLASSLHIGSEQKLKDLYSNMRNAATTPRKMYFKRLPFNYTELENRRLFRIFVTNSTRKVEKREVQFYAKTSSTIADFLNEIKQWIPTLCSKNGSQQLRIMELTLNNEINLPLRLRVCPDQTPIDKFDFCPKRHYHLEEICSDENGHNNDSVLIPVAHYTKENLIQISLEKFFPFFLNVIHNESFGDVKQRLQPKLGLTNREFEKYRFSIFNGSKLMSRCDDNMGRINLRELKSIQNVCWLGLELLLISNPRKTRKSNFSEKPIRIN
ncbi:unnamed protein product [Rotaria magnacalcarata]|uniref:Ubiquitin carboxyl-terminal hydrolase 7 n=1 Tax=Rotaria magnacalcarata TaxID=392030 RepID=A0A818YTY4_9BILA|nr:unnamed protein product [Rotaria magnacalcarata]CAF3754538.1 unnamed protein product [Rotaria magnacalcarata]